MATNDRIAAARKTGSLANVIGALRENAATGATETPASGRPQMNEIDGAIALAAHLAETGTKKGAERREAMRDVRPGVTITGKGVEKTRSTRAEKLGKTLAWAKTLTESQRHAYITGEKFEALTDRQQEMISEAFAQADNDEYSTPVDVSSYDFAAAPVDIDALPEDDTESPGDSFEVQAGEDVQSWDIDDDPWEGDVV